MARRHSGDLPLSLAQGRDRFEQWRRGRNVSARIPGNLWTLAVRLAEAHGVSRTAATLKLDYTSLRTRVEARNEAATSMPATFIEVAPPEPTADRECVVELDNGRRATMRIRLRGGDTPDLGALCRALRQIRCAVVRFVVSMTFDTPSTSPVRLTVASAFRPASGG